MSETRPFENSRLADYLRQYYKKGLFPFKPYTNWLTYSKKPSEYFNLREFVFILDKDGADVHLRYRSFADPHEFEKALCDVAPQKLDLGAVYNYAPKDGKNRADFRAMEREFIFDIDLNDYDAVRKCCEGATVCEKCWKFIVMAVKILDARLRKDFGFSALMYVFSGRRGVHCWVGDEKARKLTNIARSAFAEYLTLFEGAKMDLRPTGKGRVKTTVHPMISDSYDVIMTAENGRLVKEMVVEQRWLENEEEALKDCKNSELKEELQRIFTLRNEESRWQALCLKCHDKSWRAEREKVMDQPDKLKNLPEPPSEEHQFFLLQWVLARLYPRLDVNVSTGVNHLLKSPFCIHPKTGNVAVPIDALKVHLFDVHNCPRVDKLLEELDRAERGDEENRKILAYKHTSLAPYVEIFEKFVEETKKRKE